MRSLFLVLLSALATVVSANTPHETLESQLNQFKQLQASFEQVIHDTSGADPQQSSGVFWLKKPGQFRWNYQQPYQQEIVSNGSKIWIYDEDLEQVSIKSAMQSIQASPLSVILGESSVKERFEILNITDDKETNTISITLKPTENSQGFSSVLIAFKDNLISEMVLDDEFGQTTHLFFSDVMTNVSLKDTIFNFIVPENADVFDDSLN